MATKESTKSITEDVTGTRGFYGHAEHRNNGIFSALLKRKGRKLAMADDCKAACKQVEAYKQSADKLHQALMFVLVENPVTSKTLMTTVKTEPNWLYASMYLKTYEKIQSQGRKGQYESLEPVIKALENMDAEHERRVRKQLENLKPLTKFIGEDYWEYARLRKIYWEAIEAFDDAVTLQSKERTEQAEQTTATTQAFRNDCRLKLKEFIKNSINDQKGKHADCILKFREEAVNHHRALADCLPGETSTMSTSKQVQISKS